MRIQLGQGSAGEVTKTMLKNEGMGAFYKVCFVSTNFEFCDLVVNELYAMELLNLIYKIFYSGLFEMRWGLVPDSV